MHDLIVHRGADRGGERPASDAPRYPLKEGFAPCSAMYSLGHSGPGRAWSAPGRRPRGPGSIVPATIRPAVRILSSSSGDFRTIKWLPSLQTASPSAASMPSVTESISASASTSPRAARAPRSSARGARSAPGKSRDAVSPSVLSSSFRFSRGFRRRRRPASFAGGFHS